MTQLWLGTCGGLDRGGGERAWGADSGGGLFGCALIERYDAGGRECARPHLWAAVRSGGLPQRGLWRCCWFGRGYFDRADRLVLFVFHLVSNRTRYGGCGGSCLVGLREVKGKSFMHSFPHSLSELLADTSIEYYARNYSREGGHLLPTAGGLHSALIVT